MSEPTVPNTQWKYLIIDEDGSVTGTNDMKVAKEFASSDTTLVIDVSTCQNLWVTLGGEIKAYNIEEQQTYELGD